MNVVEQMRKFIEPKSIAILGVPRQSGEGTRNILGNLLSYGYKGKMYPVNPNASEILGVKTYRRVADIEVNDIDLAVINLPRPLVVGTARECIEKGIPSIVISTQGFGDASDDEGKRLQKELDALVKKSGTRIIGPNTYGTINGFINFSTAFVRMYLSREPVGIICQTGGFFNGIPGLKGIGKGIDLGNSCDVDFADAMEYFRQDDEVKVVILHIEGTRNGGRFIKAAKRLAQKKPVIALKAGMSEAGARAIQSHSGSIVGKGEVWSTALAQSGIIRVDDLDEIIDLVPAFLVLPSMKGRGIGITTNSGGVGTLCADACYKYNMEVARLSPASVKRLTPLFPSWLNVRNPLDSVPASLVQRQTFNTVLTEFMNTLLSDDGVDAVLYISVAPFGERLTELRDGLIKLIEAYPDKPIVCSFQGRYAEETKVELEKSGKIVVYHNPARAIRALARLRQYSAFRKGF
ncbi:MAG: CoA-binding protein [Chloroflexota bacterium]